MQRFAESYFPGVFTLPWSPDHLMIIARIQRVIVDFETLAIAMPRGSGKTSLCLVAVLWALLTGRHGFVYLIGANVEAAEALLDNLKQHLLTNGLLLEDYPEAIWPIRCLEGEARRCNGQRYYGRQTFIEWTSEQIVLPTVPGAPGSGAIVRVSGLTGGVRGAVHIRPDGSSVRPSLVVGDDLQTDASARSLPQIQERLSIINGAIYGLAGPGQRTAIIIPCTVIRPGDVADQLLDRQKNPLWQGQRTKLIYDLPSNEKLWAEYARLRAEDLRAEDGADRHTEFYARHQAAMDAGARPAWRERYNADELSAVQHAMNLKLRDEAAFWAEYQNEPKVDEAESGIRGLTPSEVAAKANGIQRGLLPTGTQFVTAFIDVQEELLFWTVCAWGENFWGHVAAYGSFPEQPRGPRSYFTLRGARRTLTTAMPRETIEARWLAAFESLAQSLLLRDWPREDGATMRCSLCLIDANYGKSTETVRAFCRRSLQAGALMPAHGRYVGASSWPLADRQKAKGERIGNHWRLSVIRNQRHVLFDTNYWKSFLAGRIRAAIGDPGSLTLHGRSGDHELFAEHLTAEQPIRTEARGRTVDEWRSTPGRENHWLDCAVGSAVAASVLGCRSYVGEQIKARKKYTQADLTLRR